MRKDSKGGANGERDKRKKRELWVVSGMDVDKCFFFPLKKKVCEGERESLCVYAREGGRECT